MSRADPEAWRDLREFKERETRAERDLAEARRKDATLRGDAA